SHAAWAGTRPPGGGERAPPGGRGGRGRPGRRLPADQHPRRAARRPGGRERRSQEHAGGGRGLPQVPLHRRRPGDHRPPFLSAGQRGRPPAPRRRLPHPAPVLDRGDRARLLRRLQPVHPPARPVRSHLQPPIRPRRRVLPGFSLSLGYPVFYLSVLVLLPIVACVSKAASLHLEEFLAAVWTERTRAAYALTFGTSLLAAAVNVVLGLL